MRKVNLYWFEQLGSWLLWLVWFQQKITFVTVLAVGSFPKTFEALSCSSKSDSRMYFDSQWLIMILLCPWSSGWSQSGQVQWRQGTVVPALHGPSTHALGAAFRTFTGFYSHNPHAHLPRERSYKVFPPFKVNLSTTGGFGELSQNSWRFCSNSRSVLAMEGDLRS